MVDLDVVLMLLDVWLLGSGGRWGYLRAQRGGEGEGIG